MIFNSNKKILKSTKKTIIADRVYIPYYCDFEKKFLIKNDIFKI